MPYIVPSIRDFSLTPCGGSKGRNRILVERPSDPWLELPNPTDPPPVSFNDVVSEIGWALAALHWVQDTIKPPEDIISPPSNGDEFSALQFATQRAAHNLSAYTAQLRKAHQPDVPTLNGRAVASFNEFALTECGERALWLGQWTESRNWSNSPANWRADGAEIVRRITDIRACWNFPDIDTAELAQRAEVEASWLRTANADGPFGTDGFRWGQVEHRGLRNQVQKLLTFLWTQPDRAADFSALAIPVFADHALEPTANQVASLRRDANEFFKVKRIPILVQIRGNRVELLSADPA